MDNKEHEGVKAIILLIGSVVIFFLLIFILQWNFFVSAAISIGLYISSSLLSIGTVMIGSTPIDKIAQGEELKKELDLAQSRIIMIGDISDSVEDKEIKEFGNNIFESGVKIIDFLNKNPNKIAGSLTFFNYDIKTALSILNNYVLLKGNVSESKIKEVENNTEKSLEILAKRFENQVDGYFQNKITDLELESSLLSKTLELGESVKTEENIETKKELDFSKELLDDLLLKQGESLDEQ